MTSAGVNMPIALLSFFLVAWKIHFGPLGLLRLARHRLQQFGRGVETDEEALKSVVCMQLSFVPYPVPLLECKRGKATEQDRVFCLS